MNVFQNAAVLPFCAVYVCIKMQMQSSVISDYCTAFRIVSREFNTVCIIVIKFISVRDLSWCNIFVFI